MTGDEPPPTDPGHDPAEQPPDDATPGDAGPQDATHHEETGLDLARATARSLTGAARAVSTGVGRSRARARRRTGAGEARSSGAHPDDRDPQTLGASLRRLVADQGWDDDVRVHGVFARWAGIVGPEVAQHTTPVSFQPAQDEHERDAQARPGGRLLVRTDSTAWATQMRLLAPTVVRRLNEELGDGTVAIIDVEGPSVPSWRRGRRSVRGGRGPRDTYG